MVDLDKVKIELKKQLIGLDEVIDQFIENVRVWYETSDLMERPLVINLWGLTGTGKTTLVRSFVELIGMSDHFIEIQFTTDKETNISTVIDDDDLDENDFVILLLDEFQNFRTIDRDGEEIKNTGYDDLWLLLSDGIIDNSKKVRKALETMYLKMITRLERGETPDDDYLWLSDFSDKYLSVSQAVDFRKFFRLKMDLKQVLRLTLEERIKIVEQALNNPNHPVFKPRIFKKLLIIISGNLNEMYEFSSDVDTFDIDPDILHNFSKTLSIVDVKSILVRRFKPEQISRLGNIHIIFPAFSRQDYYKIIRKYLDEFFAKVKNKYQIDVTYDQSLVEYVFRNSVFPAQGVRPILSGLSSLIFSKIPIFLKNADKKKIHFQIQDTRLIDTVNGTKLCLDGILDKIRRNITKDEQLLTAVHEAGHALIHSLLFGFFPHRISCAAANKENKGVTTSIQFFHNRENIIKYITTLYGGHVAELLVFGKEKTSAYAEYDISVLTKLATSLIRTQGLDKYQFSVGSPFTMEASVSVTDKYWNSNRKIRKLLRKCYKQARKLIIQHKPLFIEIVDRLNKQGVLTDKELAQIFNKFGINHIQVKEDNIIYAGKLIYKWTEFREN